LQNEAFLLSAILSKITAALYNYLPLR
jgi:hypothetical protein